MTSHFIRKRNLFELVISDVTSRISCRLVFVFKDENETDKATKKHLKCGKKLSFSIVFTVNVLVSILFKVCALHCTALLLFCQSFCFIFSWCHAAVALEQHRVQHDILQMLCIVRSYYLWFSTSSHTDAHWLAQSCLHSIEVWYWWVDVIQFH